MSKNVIRNYRYAYREHYRTDCLLSDNEIFSIWQNSPVMPTSTEQDEVVLEEMYDMQHAVRNRNDGEEKAEQ